MVVTPAETTGEISDYIKANANVDANVDQEKRKSKMRAEIFSSLFRAVSSLGPQLLDVEAISIRIGCLFANLVNRTIHVLFTLWWLCWGSKQGDRGIES